MKISSDNLFIKNMTQQATSATIECSPNSHITMRAALDKKGNKIYVITVEEK